MQLHKKWGFQSSLGILFNHLWESYSIISGNLINLLTKSRSQWMVKLIHQDLSFQMGKPQKGGQHRFPMFSMVFRGLTVSFFLGVYQRNTDLKMAGEFMCLGNTRHKRHEKTHVRKRNGNHAICDVANPRPAKQILSTLCERRPTVARAPLSMLNPVKSMKRAVIHRAGSHEH